MVNSEEDLFTSLVSGNDNASFLLNQPATRFLLLGDEGKLLLVSESLSGTFKEEGSLPIGQSLLSFKENRWLKEAVRAVLPGQSAHIKGVLHYGKSLVTGKISFLLIRLRTDRIPELSLLVFDEDSDHPDNLFHSSLDAEKLRLIAENSGDAISLHGVDGSIIYMSPSVTKIHGYSHEEIVELGEMYAVHPDDVHIIMDLLQKIGKVQQFMKIQYRFIHKKGHIVWVESSNQVIVNEQGEPVMITVITRDITVSKILEDDLRKSEEKYRILVKNLPTGVLLFDAKGEILEVNQTLLDILGSPGEAPTKMINLFEFENLIASGISEDLKKCIHEKREIAGQTEYLSKWGRKSFLLYHAVPLIDVKGEAYQAICNVRDITRMKRAEEKSQQQIDFLNVVINSMQEPFFVKDENHRWIMLNDAAVEMMGKPREDLLGKSDNDLYSVEQAKVFWEKDKLVFEQGSNVNDEIITWSDGSIRNIITYKRLYTESNTGKKYIVGTIHDITSIKKSELLLLESERKYHELFDNASDYIFTTDLSGTFTNANKAMLDKIGIELSDLSNYNIYSLCKPEILENARQVTQQLIKNGTVEPFEIETIEKEGKSYILEIQAKIIFHEGKPIGIQGIARDISEKKLATSKMEKLNRELQEISASKDKFYSIIAHDLKNPFNSLIGFSELLLEDFNSLGKEEIREYVGIIRNTAKNSLILLENLLAWSRLQTGRMVYNPVKLILAKEVEAAVTVLFSLSYRKHIEIENLVDKSLIVIADQNMLLTILNNLIMNAVKFTPNNGRITLSAEYVEAIIGEDAYAMVSVKDTGVGISKEDQAKLFSLTKPFTRPGTDKESGTGLGLMLTREMVDKHGGSLKIESEPGKGSTFSFRLPVFVP